MKNKTFIVIASLIMVLVLALCFVACDDNKPPIDENPGGGTDTPIVEPQDISITYEKADGVIFSSTNPVTAKKGDSVTFTFTTDVFYTGEPVVSVNERERKFDYDDETYTYTCKVTATKDLSIVVSGLEKAESTLLTSGTGASESPFIIKEPIDLVKMAEVINAGGDNTAMNVLGYYVLENDLDFRGQEIPIIGDGSNNYAFFGGYFNGDGHTISNFSINSDGKDYVGLFGIVQAYDMLGFTGGTIFNLKLSDYTITARNTGSTVTCGSFVGQGFGANLVLCEAKNGTVDVIGNSNYFSYAGGIIGLQRSYEDPFFSKVVYCSTQNVDIVCSSGTTYAAGGIAGYVFSEDDSILCTITNCYTTGDVSGAFHAGGIVGWMSNYAAVVSCYSTGNIHAQSHMTDTVNSEEYCHAYAGGLVGMAQLDTVVADSFATGTMSAYSPLGNAYTHTDNFVGRYEEVENGLYGARKASIFNCYYAEGGKSDDIDLTSVETIKNKLYWHEIDWIFENGSYPVINDINSSTGEDTPIQHYTYTVTLDFGNVKNEKGDSSYSTTFSDQYESMGYWYLIYDYSTEDNRQGIPSSISGQNGFASYGYFFDADCTIAVPCGFVPMRNITLYVGFADNKEVAGTYYVLANSQNDNSNNSTITLTLNVDGTFTCTDVYGTSEGTYLYDGETIIFDDARFARYYGEGTIYNHQAYTFKAVKSANGFDVYGGLYTDEDGETAELIPQDAPLSIVKKSASVVGAYYYVNGSDTVIYDFYANGKGVAIVNGVESELNYVIDAEGRILSASVDGASVSITLTNGIPTSADSITLAKTDDFRGKWQLSSLLNKYFEFDGVGNWKYNYYGYQKSGDEYYEHLESSLSGKYTLDGNKLVLDNGAQVTLENGFVKVVTSKATSIYGAQGGYYGTWTNNNADVILTLGGFTNGGYGEAKITFITMDSDRAHNEIYTLTYAPDILKEGTICLFYQGEYYGEIAYDQNSGRLEGAVYSLALSNFLDLKLCRIDEYNGEWIGESVFNIVSFNGYGVYTSIANIPLEGIITIDGREVRYTLDDFSLTGSFTYNGVNYDITLDESLSILTISSNDTTVGELVRKDELGGKTFVDENGTTYVFDGKGTLATKGTLTVATNLKAAAQYKYAFNADGSIVIYQGDDIVGGMSVVGNKGERNYVLSINSNSIKLGEKTAFTGVWALEASYSEPLTISTMNYDGVMTGKVPLSINGESKAHDAIFTMSEDGYLVWEVEEGLNLYVLKLKDGMFVVSRHVNWFNYENGDDEWNYSYAMQSDLLRGTWTNTRLSQCYHFDGMGLNPEALGIYSVSNMYGTGEDDEEEDVFYYRYCKRVDGTGYDYLIFTAYSTTAESAVKVNFCEVSSDEFANQYKNEAGDKAFTVESVNLKDYDLTID